MARVEVDDEPEGGLELLVGELPHHGVHLLLLLLLA